jgi:hypothetical protein
MMDYGKIFSAILIIIFAQMGSFVQFQMSYKYGWYDKYPWLFILASLPLGWLYLKATYLFISGFEGQIWPARLIGFALGALVFTILSICIFREPFTLKTGLCLGLGILIVMIQLFVK